MFVVLICEPWKPTSLHPKSSKDYQKNMWRNGNNLEHKQRKRQKQESKNQKMFGPHFVTFLLFSLFSKRSVSKWGPISLIQYSFSATRSALQGHAC